MKLILTEPEMAHALQHGAPIPPGYNVTACEFQKYSSDFCTLKLDKIAPEPTLLPFADLPAELPALDAAA